MSLHQPLLTPLFACSFVNVWVENLDTEAAQYPGLKDIMKVCAVCFWGCAVLTWGVVLCSPACTPFATSSRATGVSAGWPYLGSLTCKLIRCCCCAVDYQQDVLGIAQMDGKGNKFRYQVRAWHFCHFFS